MKLEELPSWTITEDDPFINISLYLGDSAALAVQVKVTDNPLRGKAGDAVNVTWAGASNEKYSSVRWYWNNEWTYQQHQHKQRANEQRVSGKLYYRFCYWF